METREQTAPRPLDPTDPSLHDQLSPGQRDPSQWVQTYSHAATPEPNLPAGILAGIATALVGAVAWAVVTYLTKYQIGWMAVGIGLMVGLSVRGLGKGTTHIYGIVGAACALGGCVLGNLLSGCAFVADAASMSVFEVIIKLLPRPDMVVELLKETFSPMDILFYAIAVYEGYKFALLRRA